MAGDTAQDSQEPTTPATHEFETDTLAYCGIQKRRAFSQSGPADPTPDPDSPFTFSNHIRANQPGVLMPSSSLTAPSGGSGRALHENGGFGLMLHAIFTNEAAMDEAYPAGDYLIRIDTSDGTTIPVTLPLGTGPYPGVPKITGSTNAQWLGGALRILNRNLAVGLEWSNPGNHSTWFNIEDSGIHSENGMPESGFTIPAGALDEDSIYRATVQFIHITGSAHGGIANSGFITELNFLIIVGDPDPQEEDFYLLIKTHSMAQVSNDGPAYLPNLLFDSDRAPYSMTAESPVAGSLSGPGGIAFPLAFHASRDGARYQYLGDPVTTAAALNAIHPNGTYLFPGSVEVAITGDLYPDVAAVVEVNGAPPVWNAQGQLALNPDIENTIAWSDVVVPEFETWGYQMVEFRNSNDDNFDGIEEERGAPTELKQPITTLTIPANSMTRTYTYNGTIEYARITTFSPVGPDAFAAAGYFSANRFMAVALNPQTITFPEIPQKTYPSAPFAMVAQAGSGLPVDFEIADGPAEISNGQLMLTGVGTVTVRATQRGNSTFASAMPVTQSFIVEASAGTLLDYFRTTHGLAADGADDMLCPAGDGVPNLLKFAFNMLGDDQGQASSLKVPNRSILGPAGHAGLPRMEMSGGRLSLTYVRIRESAAPGVRYAVEFSNSLAADSWHANTLALEEIAGIDANLERVTVTDDQPGLKRFARVRVDAD